MSLNLEQKKQVVESVSAVMQESQAAIVAEYRGMTVEQMSQFRRDAHDNGVFLRIVKNTLLKRAAVGSSFECLNDHFVGPLVFAASDDPVAVAKVVDKFQKEIDALNIKAGAMSGNLLSSEDITALAKLPSREELLAKLMGTMQAPVAKFAQTLNEVPGKFVRTLAAVRDAKEAA
ncbi:MAG: 50S ribosomal protein L10 [Arenicella sp.]